MAMCGTLAGKSRSKEYQSVLRKRLIIRRGKEVSRKGRISERTRGTKSSTTSGQWRKVSSNIRHGECGDVDLGCIPVLQVACMSRCVSASIHTSPFRSTADAHLRGQI